MGLLGITMFAVSMVALLCLQIYAFLKIETLEKRLELRRDNANYDFENLKVKITKLNKKHDNIIRFMKMSDKELNKRIKIFERLYKGDVLEVSPTEVVIQYKSSGHKRNFYTDNFLARTELIYKYEQGKK